MVGIGNAEFRTDRSHAKGWPLLFLPDFVFFIRWLSPYIYNSVTQQCHGRPAGLLARTFPIIYNNITHYRVATHYTLHFKGWLHYTLQVTGKLHITHYRVQGSYTFRTTGWPHNIIKLHRVTTQNIVYLFQKDRKILPN